VSLCPLLSSRRGLINFIFSVTAPEPLPDGHPLWSLSNAIITPHCSGLSRDYFVRAVDLLTINVKRIEGGLGALNAVRGKGE
jgi:phosphoglycerate dehydrogenase-like enzyme